MQNKKTKKPRNRCNNCKHAGDKFKVNGVTHMHCQHPDRVKECQSAWDTLQEFWDSCEKHKPIENT